MMRYLVWVGLLAAVVAGCGVKEAKGPGGPTAVEAKKEAAAEMPADPFASGPALEIPKLEPPKLAPPKRAAAK